MPLLWLTFLHNEQLWWQWEADMTVGWLHIHPRIHHSSTMTAAKESHSLRQLHHSQSWSGSYHSHCHLLALHSSQHFWVGICQRRIWKSWDRIIILTFCQILPRKVFFCPFPWVWFLNGKRLNHCIFINVIIFSSNDRERYATIHINLCYQGTKETKWENPIQHFLITLCCVNCQDLTDNCKCESLRILIQVHILEFTTTYHILTLPMFILLILHVYYSISSSELLNSLRQISNWFKIN